MSAPEISSDSPYVKVLAALAVLYTLHFAAPILVPFTIALLLAFALAPLVRLLSRAGLPSAVGAAIIVFGGLAILGLGLSVIAEPAVAWIDQAPAYVHKAGSKLRSLGSPVLGTSMQVLQDASAGVEQLTDAAEMTAGEGVTKVKVQNPSFLDNALSGTARMVATSIAILFFLYFVLASGSRVTDKVAKLIEYRVSKTEIVTVARRLQEEVSRYLLTISIINASLGALTTLWLLWLDVDNALLWGSVVAVLNFAPYVGAVASACLLALVSIIQFDELARALVVVGGFGLLTVFEGQLVTPLIVGRRLQLSPYIVFVGIILWGWLWGIPGTLMAVPLIMSARILCEGIPELRWISVLVAREEPVPKELSATKPQSA